MKTALETVSEKFAERFKRTADIFIKSPGRINIIGEHTDYNRGFVLPGSSQFAVYFAASLNGSTAFNIFSSDFDEDVELNSNVSLQDAPEWAHFFIKVAEYFRQKSIDIPGLDVAFGGDLPIGAGMSSSTALVGGFTYVLNELLQLGMSRKDLFRWTHEAELGVGVDGGIMDQFALFFGKKNRALFVDCLTEDYRQVSIDLTKHEFALFNTGKKHKLIDSEYNDRRRSCERVVEVLSNESKQIKSLREVSFTDLDKAEISAADKIKAEFVLEENNRVCKAEKAINSSDFQSLGQLLLESHRGLQHKYEVSCAELDFIVKHATQFPGILGARMMGAGFGGCVLVLGKRGKTKDFFHHIGKSYSAAFSLKLKYHDVEFANGISAIIKTELKPNE